MKQADDLNLANRLRGQEMCVMSSREALVPTIIAPNSVYTLFFLGSPLKSWHPCLRPQHGLLLNNCAMGHKEAPETSSISLKFSAGTTSEGANCEHLLGSGHWSLAGGQGRYHFILSPTALGTGPYPGRFSQTWWLRILLVFLLLLPL